MECDLGTITFNYETVGEGRQILMLHGWPLDHTQLVLESAGHLMWGEQPSVCSALVSEWLDRVERWS